MNQIEFFSLPGGFPWAEQIHIYDTLPSTNDLLKTMAAEGAPHGTSVVARRQTAGRGRMGRSFYSPDRDGMYCSVLLRPNCPATAIMHLTCAVAVAICDAMEQTFSFRPGIKWTNDIVYQGRKLGGILTELTVDASGNVNSAIIGIGINCNQQLHDFPEDIRGFAGSVRSCTGRFVDIDTFTYQVLKSLYGLSADLLKKKDDIMQTYRRDCITLGKEISVIQGDTVFHAVATAIADDGGLTVTCENGDIKTVQSGEVSIRGMYGYLE